VRGHKMKIFKEYDQKQSYLLPPMVEQVEENLGKTPDEISADAGYSSYDNLEYAENKEIDAYIPDNKIESLDKKEEYDKRYDKSNFSYDEKAVPPKNLKKP